MAKKLTDLLPDTSPSSRSGKTTRTKTPPGKPKKWENGLQPNFVTDEIRKTMSLLVLKMDNQHLTALTRFLLSKNWTAYQVSTVCYEIATNPEIAKQVRIYGAIVPADFVSAFRSRFGDPADHDRRRHEQEELKRIINPRSTALSQNTKDLIEETFKQLGGRPQTEEEVRESDRRLREGTSAPPIGTPEYDEYWKEYYSRPDIKRVQEIVKNRR